MVFLNGSRHSNGCRSKGQWRGCSGWGIFAHCNCGEQGRSWRSGRQTLLRRWGFRGGVKYRQNRLLGSLRRFCRSAGSNRSPTGAQGRPEAGSSTSGNRPLPADTLLLLGGIITGSHGAKTSGVLAVNIPGVKIDGGHAFRKQGKGGEGSEAPMGMTRFLARILFAALATVVATRLPRTSERPHSESLSESKSLLAGPPEFEKSKVNWPVDL